MADNRMRIRIDNARLLPYPFKNFSGRVSMYNQNGRRQFCVALDAETAQQMKKDGWNVKLPDPKDPEVDEYTRDPYIQIEARFDVLPPKIVMITSRGRTFVTEDMVELLDGMEFSNVDLIANASNWNVGEKSGIKAYLKTMYATVDEDELDEKYAEVEHS